MKIIFLAGSPHSNTLVNEFIKGAKDTKKEAGVIDLAHIDIHPYLGCDAVSSQLKMMIDRFYAKMMKITY